MQKLVIISVLLFSALMSCELSAANVIDFPYYESHSSDVFDVRRVESDDMGVTVYADLYSRPDSWVKIASKSYIKGGRSGRVLPLLSCEGIELDKEVYPGESGRIPFVMKFGSLAAEDDTFDFIESDAAGAFKVSGISLDMPLSYGDVTCHLEGEVLDPKVSRLLVIENDEDIRTLERYVSIPVTDGHFSYDFHADNEKYYQLIPYHEMLKGAFRAMEFFAYDGTVNVTIPADNKMIIVTSDMPDQKVASELRDRYTRNREVLDSIEKTFTMENTLTPEGLALREKIMSAEGDERKALIEEYNSGDFFTDEFKAYRKMVADARSEALRDEIETFEKRPSLFAIVKCFAMMKPYVPEEIKAPYIHLYDSILVNYRPDYYYHEKINTLRRAELLQPGNPYIDYDLTDSDGSKVKISELIDGKVTIVDLWASWCGPCRRLSKSYIPLYEKYKGSGLNIIGIAREQNPEAMDEAISRDGYPWKNYLELNDDNRIWELNGVNNGGGTSFLIDKDGTILLVHPTAEQVEQVLEKLKSDGRL